MNTDTEASEQHKNLFGAVLGLAAGLLLAFYLMAVSTNIAFFFPIPIFLFSVPGWFIGKCAYRILKLPKVSRKIMIMAIIMLPLSAAPIGVKFFYLRYVALPKIPVLPAGKLIEHHINIFSYPDIQLVLITNTQKKEAFQYYETELKKRGWVLTGSEYSIYGPETAEKDFIGKDFQKSDKILRIKAEKKEESSFITIIYQQFNEPVSVM